MKSRQLHFYVQAEVVTSLTETVRNRVVPRYEEFPHFLGLTLLKVDLKERAEIVITSYWDDGLVDSEQMSAQFIDEIVKLTGSNPVRKVFDILYASVRDSNGELCVE